MSSSTIKTTVDRKTLKILNTNSVHFITIALLFTPFNFFFSAAVQFYLPFSSGDFTANFEPFNLRLIKTLTASSQTPITINTLITLLTVAFFVILPAIAGIALITYSTHDAIYHTPLTFSSTFKSLKRSYLPLISTIFVGSVNLIAVTLLLTVFPTAVDEAIKALGFQFDLSMFSIFINTLVSLIIPIVIYFFVANWGSAAAISVLESKSGFEALNQSENQSAEFRSHSFSILYITCCTIGSSIVYVAVSQSIESTRNWISILLVGFVNLQSSLMILQYAAANTVLYVQFTEARGGEVAKTAVDGEVSGEYVKLVVDEEDDDVSREVVNNNEESGGFSYILGFVSVVLIILIALGPVFW